MKDIRKKRKKIVDRYRNKLREGGYISYFRFIKKEWKPLFDDLLNKLRKEQQ